MNRIGRKIPLVDLQAQLAGIAQEVENAILRVVKSGWFVGGPEVDTFEKRFAEFCDARYCVSVSSGTDALRLALIASGIGSGDEVITVPNTFIATTEAISMVGARPVFVDVRPDTFHIDLRKVEELLARRKGAPNAIKAIIPVHLYGQPADMKPLCEIAQHHGLKVIEDACQAHGALYFGGSVQDSAQDAGERNGRRVGSIGDAGCFSFYPGKNLGAYGDGGAVVTNDEAVAEKVAMLRDHGRLGKKYEHEVEGCNSRLDALQAAVLSVKLNYLNQWNERRREHAAQYNALLGEIPGVITPQEVTWGTHVYHLYVIRVRKRDALFQKLRSEGIDAGIHYPIPLHLQKAYHYLGYQRGDFPVTEEVAEEIVSLPMFPELRTDDIEMIVEKIRDWMQSGNT